MIGSRIKGSKDKSGKSDQRQIEGHDDSCDHGVDDAPVDDDFDVQGTILDDGETEREGNHH